MARVLIDGPAINGWVHLVADTIPDLHAFAQQAGIKKCWFENKKGRNQPHYDVHSKDIKKCLLLGAERVSRRELHTFLKTTYGKIMNKEDLKEFGKVEICEETTGGLFHIRITEGFDNNAVNTFKLMKKINIMIGDKFSFITKCVSDKNLFEYMLSQKT